MRDGRRALARCGTEKYVRLYSYFAHPKRRDQVASAGHRRGIPQRSFQAEQERKQKPVASKALANACFSPSSFLGLGAWATGSKNELTRRTGICIVGGGAFGPATKTRRQTPSFCAASPA